MRKVKKLFFREKKKQVLGDLKQELLNKSGAEQFKKLLDKGLTIPIVVL